MFHIILSRHGNVANCILGYCFPTDLTHLFKKFDGHHDTSQQAQLVSQSCMPYHSEDISCSYQQGGTDMGDLLSGKVRNHCTRFSWDWGKCKKKTLQLIPRHRKDNGKNSIQPTQKLLTMSREKEWVNS